MTRRISFAIALALLGVGSFATPGLAQPKSDELKIALKTVMELNAELRDKEDQINKLRAEKENEQRKLKLEIRILQTEMKEFGAASKDDAELIRLLRAEIDVLKKKVEKNNPGAAAKDPQTLIAELRAKLAAIDRELGGPDEEKKMDEKKDERPVDEKRERQVRALRVERREVEAALAVALENAPRPAPKEVARTMIRMLEQPIDTKGLQEKVRLKTALEYIADKFAGRLSMLVDREAFRTESGSEAFDPYEEEVSLPPAPSKMPMNIALHLILTQVGKGQAVFVVRQGFIEITTQKFASASVAVGRSTVAASFDQKPLADVLDELTEQTGVAIQLDPNVGKKGSAAIKAVFRGSPLEDALVTVTEMAELKYVVLDRSVFVTTPERATAIRKEEKKRAALREKLPKQPTSNSKRIEAAAP